MTKPQLYLLVGYPGAGKTTVSRIIAETTGAVHVWADRERLRMFGTPTHSDKENDALYASLNEKTAQLLAKGKSVIFDTNFNFVKDRLYLRTIADQCGAGTTVIWVATPKTVAKARAVRDSNLRNGYKFLMSEDEFDTIASHLEPPTKDEKVVKIDGVKLDSEALIQLLKP